MPGNKFNQTHPPIGPPAYCWYRKDPLPIILPPIGSPQLQGYARWTDLDPVMTTDIAIYTTMNRRGDDWFWSGQITKNRRTLSIVCARAALPNNWQVTIEVDFPTGLPEQYTWYDLHPDPDRDFDTGPLTHITIPAFDFRHARVTI